jgi:hypothetical protein
MFGKYILTYYMCNIYNVFGYKKKYIYTGITKRN